MSYRFHTQVACDGCERLSGFHKGVTVFTPNGWAIEIQNGEVRHYCPSCSKGPTWMREFKRRINEQIIR